jgi:thiol-disulfide isomerase/thioredoxin
MTRRLAVFVLLGALLTGGAHAQPLAPFTATSIKEISASHASAPFVLAFWSLSCSHCPDELAMLGALAGRHGSSAIVLVSTDTPDDRATILATLKRHALTDAEAWVFADPFVERLRYAIDPRWHGELPRTYFMRDGQVARAVSGRVDRSEIEAWIAPEIGR